MKFEKEQIKVLHICPNFPYTKLYNLMISQIEYSHQNIVYVASSAKAVNTTYPVYYLGRDFGLLDRAFFYRKQNIALKDVEKKGLCEEVTLIHAHNLFNGGYIARKLSKRKRIPYIVAVRNTDVNVFFKRMIHLRHVGINIMKEAAAVVFLSPAYRNQVIEQYVPFKYRKEILNKSYVIPNGIDRLFLENTPDEAKRITNGQRIKLVYVGEVNTNKNTMTTLKACELLEGKGYKPTLTIVGRISDPKYECIKKNRFVEYHPQSPKEEVIDYYKKNDIFVMPSLNETFGLVYVEAMSQGLPIIYSKGQGIDGYFKEGFVGYHVDSLEAQDIATAVEKILSDYSTLSQHGIEASKKFSWEEIVKAYIDMYRLLLHKS